MGEAQTNVFEPDFNRSIKVQAVDGRLTSHAGAILLRDFDHRLGLTESLADRLIDPRRQDRVRYQGVELLRERLYAMALGESDQDDLDRLAHDPAMKMAAWDRPGEEVLNQRLASQPTQSRLIDWLADCKTNLEAVRSALFDWIHRHVKSTGDSDRRVRYATIDIDSFPIQVYGQQPGARYNGYYKETVYHPRNRSQLGAANLGIGLDLNRGFRAQYRHEQDPAGTRRSDDARRKGVRPVFAGADRSIDRTIE